MAGFKPFSGAILAAGLGTRLAPLTDHCPKPLVPVAGRPLIEYAFDALSAVGVTEIGVNAHYLAEQVKDALSTKRCEIIKESELRGTGGGLKGIAARLSRGPLISINGDSIFDFSLEPLIAAHRRSMAFGTLVLRSRPADSAFPPVEVDSQGRILRIAEVFAPGYDEKKVVKSGVFCGVHFAETEIVAALPDEPCDVLRTAYKKMLEQRAMIRGVFVPDDAHWADVGDMSRYLEVHRSILKGELFQGVTPWLPDADEQGRRISKDAVIEAGAKIVGPCAILAGAHVAANVQVGPFAFIDRDATVSANVQNAVVWAGASVNEDSENTVVISDR